jgi:hypothetical protein
MTLSSDDSPGMRTSKSSPPSRQHLPDRPSLKPWYSRPSEAIDTAVPGSSQRVRSLIVETAPYSIGEANGAKRVAKCRSSRNRLRRSASLEARPSRWRRPCISPAISTRRASSARWESLAGSHGAGLAIDPSIWSSAPTIVARSKAWEPISSPAGLVDASHGSRCPTLGDSSRPRASARIAVGLAAAGGRRST